jgi:hypothetical protein
MPCPETHSACHHCVAGGELKGCDTGSLQQSCSTGIVTSLMPMSCFLHCNILHASTITATSSTVAGSGRPSKHCRSAQGNQPCCVTQLPNVLHTPSTSRRCRCCSVRHCDRCNDLYTPFKTSKELGDVGRGPASSTFAVPTQSFQVTTVHLQLQTIPELDDLVEQGVS